MSTIANAADLLLDDLERQHYRERIKRLEHLLAASLELLDDLANVFERGGAASASDNIRFAIHAIETKRKASEEIFNR